MATPFPVCSKGLGLQRRPTFPRTTIRKFLSSCLAIRHSCSGCITPFDATRRRFAFVADLQLARVKRIALTQIPRLVTLTKPAHSLFGSAVRKRICDSATSRTALQSVIANRSGGAHCFFDVTRFDDLLCAVGIACPDASEKIRLQ